LVNLFELYDDARTWQRQNVNLLLKLDNPRGPNLKEL